MCEQQLKRRVVFIVVNIKRVLGLWSHMPVVELYHVN